MKLAKYLLVVCLGLFLSACNSDDDWNTNSDVSVEMGESVIKTRENKKVFYVPLKVNGTTNGPIKVKVDVEEISASPAVEDVNYYITSKSVVIPADSVEVSIEIVPVNDKELNDERMFVLSIVNVEGAKIGAQKTCEITIRDDDDLPYEAVQGDTWKFAGIDFFDYRDGIVTPVNYSFSISGYEEEDFAYNKALLISGWGGVASLTAEASYHLNSDGEITLYIPAGQSLGTVALSGYGECPAELDVYTYPGYGANGAYATVNPELNTITFDENTMMGVFVYDSDGNELGYIAMDLHINIAR